MSRLQTLRFQLRSLSRWRQWYRWGIALAAAAIALLWILALIFVLDFVFKLDVLQRAVVIAAGGAILVWAIAKFVAPFLQQGESELDMALFVERQHGIDSDLVAALQFDSPGAADWGSPELEEAVIDYVSQLDRGLNVFAGFSREQFVRRTTTLAVTLGIAALLVALFPAHAMVFLNHLAMGNLHYPSETTIESITINAKPVLIRAEHGTSPKTAKSPQGQAVVFGAWVNGKIPTTGVANLYSSTLGPARKITLEKIDRQQLQTLSKTLTALASSQTEAELQQASSPLSGDRQNLANQVAMLTPFDRAQIDEALASPMAAKHLFATAAENVTRLSSAAPTEKTAQLFVGKLPRLLDEVRYKVELGDAWTDPSQIHMISLPVVVPHITDVPPEYARAAKDEPQPDAASLQRSVIEGSEVSMTFTSTKPLKSAEVRIIDAAAGQPLSIALKKTDAAGTSWKLDPAGTPFAQVLGPIRFEVQVQDEDDLSLEIPLRGFIRLKADRPPRIGGSLVHRAILPDARPEIEIRASDDYGIANMELKVEVLRSRGLSEPASAATSAPEIATFPIAQLMPLRGNLDPASAEKRKSTSANYPILGERIPLAASYVANLSSLKLQRGDELRLTLVAKDYRGTGEGVTSESEPMLLEITDESGILAAVSEGDRRSQEQMDDLIRRQLGIGESP